MRPAPQAALNRAAMRAERRLGRRVALALATALCLTVAVGTLARMTLEVALNIDTLAAQALAARGM